jgi:hypothetical protein
MSDAPGRTHALQVTRSKYSFGSMGTCMYLPTLTSARTLMPCCPPCCSPLLFPLCCPPLVVPATSPHVRSDPDRVAPSTATSERLVPMFPQARRPLTASASLGRSTGVPRDTFLVKTSVDDMMNRPYSRTGVRSVPSLSLAHVHSCTSQALPPYDPLSDPALQGYWMRKFGWAMGDASTRPSVRRPQSAKTDGDLMYRTVSFTLVFFF